MPVHKYLDTLILLTNRVGRLLAARLRNEQDIEHAELVGPHTGILVDLAMKDGLRQQDLAMSAIKDKATIARSLVTLERKGMVKREIDPSDRRNKRIHLTDKGRGWQGHLMQRAQVLTEEATAGISAEEMATCIKVLRKMYESLKD